MFKISDIYNDPKFSDITIKLHSGEIYVHSLILKMCSPMLDTMLNSGMKFDGTIKFQNSDNVVKAVIKYMYFGNFMEEKVKIHKLIKFIDYLRMDQNLINLILLNPNKFIKNAIISYGGYFKLLDIFESSEITPLLMDLCIPTRKVECKALSKKIENPINVLKCAKFAFHERQYGQLYCSLLTLSFYCVYRQNYEHMKLFQAYVISFGKNNEHLHSIIFDIIRDLHKRSSKELTEICDILNSIISEKLNDCGCKSKKNICKFCDYKFCNYCSRNGKCLYCHISCPKCYNLTYIKTTKKLCTECFEKEIKNGRIIYCTECKYYCEGYLLCNFDYLHHKPATYEEIIEAVKLKNPHYGTFISKKDLKQEK